MKHYNATISEDVNRIFNPKGESLNSEVLDQITPTIEIKRHCNICKAGAAAGSTSSVIYTTPADKDFYLTAACLSLIKDVTATSNQSKLTVVIEGTTVAVLVISSITLTIQNDVVANTWFNPIKCDRGSAITLNNSAATANIRSDAAIQGYTVETTKGV